MVEKPVRKDLPLDLMGEYFTLKVISIFSDPIFLLLVELHSELRLFLLVVGFEGHPVEVESFSWGKIHIVLLFRECLLYGLLSLQLLIADFYYETDHLSNLVIDEALPH